MAGSLSQVQLFQGELTAIGASFAIVVSRFNGTVTERLVEGAVDTLTRMGADSAAISVIWVPGAWEIPQTAARILNLQRPDAIIGLGCLLRGETIHFDLIAREVAKGLSALGGRGEVPILFGVLTTENLEQAMHRAGGKYGNKGAEVAQAAVEQVQVYRQLRGNSAIATEIKRSSSRGAAVRKRR